MIGYTTIGVTDMERSLTFYDALLAEVGGKQVMGMDRIKFYSDESGTGMLAICIPYDENEQHCGNGNMVAIAGGSKEGAKALYDKAMQLGASDDGEPGDRAPFFYGGYVRDFDGNKLCFYHMTLDG